MERIYRHNIFIISLIVSLALSILIFGSDVEASLVQLRSASLEVLLLAPLALGIEICLRGIRLQVMTTIWQKQIGFWRAIQINLAGDFANAVTPASIGGGPVRGYQLVRSKMTIEEATATIIGERLTDHLALVVLSVVLLLLSYDSFEGAGRYLVYMGGVSLIGCAACYVYFRSNSKFRQGTTGQYLAALFGKMIGTDSLPGRYAQRFIQFWGRLRHDLRHMVTLGGKRFLFCGVLAILNQSVRTCIPVILAYALHLDVPVTACVLWILAKRYGLDSMPIPGANGITEAAFLWFFGRYTAASLLGPFLILWRFFSYYVYLILGGAVTVWMVGDRAAGLKSYLTSIGNDQNPVVEESV